MNWINKLFNLGVAQNDAKHDKRLKWALNVLTLNSIFCICLAMLLEMLIDKQAPNLMLIGSFLLFGSVLILNKYKQTYLGVTILFIVCNVLLVYYSIITGEQTFTYGLFILFIIGLALLYRNEHSKTYFFFNLLLTLFCISFVMLSYSMHWFEDWINNGRNPSLARQINFYFLLFCTAIFSIVVIISYNNHYREMRNALNTQKFLFEEVNHRVKNNLSVIISLLNLKKNNSESKETRDAINEIQGRIMAMSMVHQQIYRKDENRSIVMDKYVKDLVKGIHHSLGGQKNVGIKTNVDNIFLDDNVAIPLGLALNELITNSIKHAFTEKSNNEIEIKLLNSIENKGKLELVYRDNGVGIKEGRKDKGEGGLGLNLIRTLSQQLEGTCTFLNDSGFVCKMEFTP